jgi:hypothetical protein
VIVFLILPGKKYLGKEYAWVLNKLSMYQYNSLPKNDDDDDDDIIHLTSTFEEL